MGFNYRMVYSILIVILLLSPELVAQINQGGYYYLDEESDQQALIEEHRIRKIEYYLDTFTNEEQLVELSIPFGLDSLNESGKSVFRNKLIGLNAFKTSYTYFDNGKLKSKISKDKDNFTVYKSTYEYSSDNRIITEKHNERGLRKMTSITEFDDSGKLVVFNLKDKKRDIYVELDYISKKGRIVEVEKYSRDHYTGSDIYKYNRKGNIIKSYRTRNGRKWDFVEQKFNKSNQLVERSYKQIRKRLKPTKTLHLNYFRIDKERDEVKYRYSYYENGLVKSKTEYLNGKKISKLNFHYSP